MFTLLAKSKTLLALSLAAAGLTFAAQPASASNHFSFSLSLPIFSAPCAPAPVYAAPVYAPAPTYCPAPVYVPAPVYCPPPVVVYERPAYYPGFFFRFGNHNDWHHGYDRH